MKTSNSQKKHLFNDRTKRILSITIVITFLAFAILPLLSLNITSTFRSSLAKLLPKTHQSLDFSQAELNGDLSVTLFDFAYRPDPPLEFKSKEVTLSFSIWQILVGNLRLFKIESQKFEINLPQKPHWFNKATWERKLSELSERREWMSFLQSQWSFDTLDLSLPQTSILFADYQAKQEFSNGAWTTQGEWATAFSSEIPNLYEGNYKLLFYPDSIKGAFETQSTLGFVKGEISKTTAQNQIRAKTSYRGSLDKLNAWLFNSQADLKGELQSEIEWKTDLLYPLKRLTAKGSFQARKLKLSQLSFQKEPPLTQFAPHLKEIDFDQLSGDLKITPQHIELFKINAKGKQLDFTGNISSNWKAQFKSDFDILLSKASTDSLSPMARQSLPINSKGEAHFNIKLSGTPQQHHIDNLGELFASALEKNLKAVGEAILDFFN